MMCEIPSNAILAEQFLEHFDGMSIGSNDLTQLTLGLDRDSGPRLLARDFDERDPAVKAMISRAITACRAVGKYIGICGQGPSDHPDFADWLAREGIVSISLNPTRWSRPGSAREAPSASSRLSISRVAEFAAASTTRGSPSPRRRGSRRRRIAT